MKNNSENKSSPQEDEKIHISKSIFETNREMKQKAAEEELKKQAERERILAEKKKKAEEERAKRLEEERLELIRLKQGIIEESDTIKDEEPEAEEVKRTLGQKISSFFYLNKWWLTLTAVFGTIAGILLHSYLTRPNPDVTILIIGTNYTLAEESELKAYAETFIEDYNENGKIEAAIHYIPYTGEQTSDYANAAATRLSAELQSDNCAIIIGNKLAAEMLGDERLAKQVEISAKAHAEFLLPDGAIDNAAGSRSVKWTYYGSRTSDGALPLWAWCARRGIAWGVRAIDRTLSLLIRCTGEDNLLMGGPDYAVANEPSCVHHTFTHVKSLAELLEEGAPECVSPTLLPREVEYGHRHIDALDVDLQGGSRDLLVHGQNTEGQVDSQICRFLRNGKCSVANLGHILRNVHLHQIITPKE